MRQKFVDLFAEMPDFCKDSFRKSHPLGSPGDATSWQHLRELTRGDLTKPELYFLDNYNSIVGMIGWPAKQTRPGLAQSFSMLSRALKDPQPQDARMLRKILQYIWHHRH